MRTKEGCERNRIIRDIKAQFNIGENPGSVVESLVEELYWQIIKMKECRDILDGEAIVVEFIQGKQEMLIQNPVLKTYNDLVKNQTATLKNLVLVTGKDSKEAGNAELKNFVDFLGKGKKQTRVS